MPVEAEEQSAITNLAQEEKPDVTVLEHITQMVVEAGSHAQIYLLGHGGAGADDWRMQLGKGSDVYSPTKYLDMQRMAAAVAEGMQKRYAANPDNANLHITVFTDSCMSGAQSKEGDPMQRIDPASALSLGSTDSRSDDNWHFFDYLQAEFKKLENQKIAAGLSVAMFQPATEYVTTWSAAESDFSMRVLGQLDAGAHLREILLNPETHAGSFGGLQWRFLLQGGVGTDQQLFFPIYSRNGTIIQGQEYSGIELFDSNYLATVYVEPLSQNDEGTKVTIPVVVVNSTGETQTVVLNGVEQGTIAPQASTRVFAEYPVPTTDLTASTIVDVSVQVGESAFTLRPDLKLATEKLPTCSEGAVELFRPEEYKNKISVSFTTPQDTIPTKAFATITFPHSRRYGVSSSSADTADAPNASSVESFQWELGDTKEITIAPGNNSFDMIVKQLDNAVYPFRLLVHDALGRIIPIEGLPNYLEVMDNASFEDALKNGPVAPGIYKVVLTNKGFRDDDWYLIPPHHSLKLMATEDLGDDPLEGMFAYGYDAVVRDIVIPKTNINLNDPTELRTEEKAVVIQIAANRPWRYQMELSELHILDLPLVHG